MSRVLRAEQTQTFSLPGLSVPLEATESLSGSEQEERRDKGILKLLLAQLTLLSGPGLAPSLMDSHLVF